MAEKNNFVHGIAYGKLYLAGEYAILEDYSKALITSVDKKIIAFVEPANEITIFDTVHKISIGLYEKNDNFKLIQEFLIFLQQYTQSNKKFALTIRYLPPLHRLQHPLSPEQLRRFAEQCAKDLFRSEVV